MIVDVFIAGAQKSGTTSLFAHLARHPALTPPRRKEIHHFDNESLDWGSANSDLLHAFFDPGPLGSLYFEATPIYGFWPQSLERIHRYNPVARIIFVFRDPIERAYSHWRMERRRKTEPLPFAAAIREGRSRLPLDNPTHGDWRDRSYVERGFYGRQLARARSVFPPEQILCLNSDDLDRRPEVVLASIAHFLGIADFPPGPPIREHLSPDSPDLERVSREDYDHLCALYAADLQVFAALSGLDVSSWWISRSFD